VTAQHAVRVALFAHLPFHRPILEPVRDDLAPRADCLLSSDRERITGFDPHVLAMAGHAHLEHFRERLPRTLMVNVRHGLVGKAIISRLPNRQTARWFDYVCVGAEGKIATYERSGVAPREYWLTGYPQLDPLFRRDDPPSLPLPPGRKTVLYAPTWNLGLTSAAMLGARLVELIRAEAPDVNVVIKPHPVIGDWRPRWMARWERLAATARGVHLVRDTHADVTPYLLAADVLVSDASSVIFEFLALDRPIILVTNPRHAADPAYDPEDIIWSWRDVGEEVHAADLLPGAVARALHCPAARAQRRRDYGSLLFGPFTDGQNHARVAEKILGVATAVAAGAAPAPARRVAGGSAAERRWYDFRIRLGTSSVVRRHLLNPLEELRLRARALRLRPSSAR
jgi:CDP-glycerol:poly(glycerophosphate) glycerophosphotransferase